MFIAALIVTVKRLKQPKHPSIDERMNKIYHYIDKPWTIIYPLKRMQY